MAERIHEEGVEPLSSFGPRIKVKGQPTADNGGCIMTQHKTSCLAAVLASLCITLYMAGGANGCTGERYCGCSV